LKIENYLLVIENAVQVLPGQSGQGQNGHFHFGIVSFAHYNKYKIFIIVAVLTLFEIDFDK